MALHHRRSHGDLHLWERECPGSHAAWVDCATQILVRHLVTVHRIVVQSRTFCSEYTVVYCVRSFCLLMPCLLPQIDSIPPRYSCPKADAIRNAYQSVPAWTAHLEQNADLKGRLDATLGTAGRSDWASWCELCKSRGLDCAPVTEMSNR